MSEYFGYDALLKIAGVTIGQVRDIEGPGLKMDTVEVTTRDTSKWRKRIAGLKDGGTVTFEIVYDPDTATHANASGGVPYLLLQGTSAAFTLVLPDAAAATTIAFTAFVTSFKPKAAMEGALTADLELQITGAVTIT
jgi:predicted secreted protein